MARQITGSHVLVRMVKHSNSQGNSMHCRLQDTTSRWALSENCSSKQFVSLGKDTGSAGCVYHNLSSSSCDSPRDQPSAVSHDATSFQRMLLVQGVFWQIRYLPAVPVQWQDQGTRNPRNPVLDLTSARVCLSSVDGSWSPFQQL